MNNTQPVGSLLRGWRRRRRLSQLALAVDAEISQRHLSFIESGRASPSREMLLAVDRYWSLVTANAPAMRLMTGVDASLLEPPVNVLRVSLHPAGLAARIVNFHEWRAHVLERLAQQVEASADAVLEGLLEELKRYPAPAGAARRVMTDLGGLAVPLQLRTDAGVFSFVSTTTVFGTPIDVTLSELAIESFFPADEATTTAMWQMAEAR